MANITSTIVNVNATVTAAPTPSTLQQSGALISLGGTSQVGLSYTYYATLAQVIAALSNEGNYEELQDMATTYFAQGPLVGVYILELGLQATPSLAVAALSAWITANPNVMYAYLLPANWDTVGSAVNTMAATYSSPNGKTYFVVTTSQATISQYTATNKAIIAVVPSPSAAPAEFQAAVLLYQVLVNNPSVANLAAPLDFRFAYGVTPWNAGAAGNQAAINAILSASGNLIATGAEGGISTALIRNGTTMDGSQFMFWYAVDWVLINAKQQLAAAIINGSNSQPPLYYSQVGINTLLAILNDIGVAGQAFGLLLASTFSAVSFSTYTSENPSAYAAGIYNGFSATITPQNGFVSITFYLDATQFAPAAA